MKQESLWIPQQRSCALHAQQFLIVPQPWFLSEAGWFPFLPRRMSLFVAKQPNVQRWTAVLPTTLSGLRPSRHMLGPTGRFTFKDSDINAITSDQSVFTAGHSQSRCNNVPRLPHSCQHRSWCFLYIIWCYFWYQFDINDQQTLAKPKNFVVIGKNIVDCLNPYRIPENEWTTEIKEYPCVTYPDIVTFLDFYTKSLVCGWCEVLQKCTSLQLSTIKNPAGSTHGFSHLIDEEHVQPQTDPSSAHHKAPWPVLCASSHQTPQPTQPNIGFM